MAGHRARVGHPEEVRAGRLVEAAVADFPEAEVVLVEAEAAGRGNLKL